MWRIYKYGTTETGVWSSHIINNLIHEYAELLLNKFRNVFQSYLRKTNKFMLSARNLLIEKQNTMAHTSKELNVLMHLLLTFPITYGWPLGQPMEKIRNLWTWLCFLLSSLGLNDKLNLSDQK